jgi:hypothetical protein
MDVQTKHLYNLIQACVMMDYLMQVILDVHTMYVIAADNVIYLILSMYYIEEHNYNHSIQAIRYKTLYQIYV